MEEAGKFLKAESNAIAPIEDGDLIVDSFVDVSRVSKNEVAVTVGYGPPGSPSADYAIPQHELPIYKKKKVAGRRWKFLEEPYRKHKNKMIRMVGEHASKGIK